MNTQPENSVPPVMPTEKEPERYQSVASFLFDILEMFAWSFFVILLLFTFVFRICRVEGRSMENTLYDGQNLLLTNLFYTPEQGDIVVFHLTKPEVGLEKTLVKRVIATEGQTVKIDFKNCEIYVDGVRYEDENAVLKISTDQIIGQYTHYAEYGYNPATGVFSATVPENSVFVLGDNRNNSKDSRDSDIGFVSNDCILGKVFLRLWPFGSLS